MVRQPREAVGEEALLELPAGKLDVEGETPLEMRQARAGRGGRRGPREWRELKRSTDPGFTDEEVHIFEATDLARAAEASDERADRDRRRPLAELDGVIEECRDAKSLVGAAAS